MNIDNLAYGVILRTGSCFPRPRFCGRLKVASKIEKSSVSNGASGFNPPSPRFKRADGHSAGDVSVNTGESVLAELGLTKRGDKYTAYRGDGKGNFVATEFGGENHRVRRAEVVRKKGNLSATVGKKAIKLFRRELKKAETGKSNCLDRILNQALL